LRLPKKFLIDDFDSIGSQHFREFENSNVVWAPGRIHQVAKVSGRGIVSNQIFCLPKGNIANSHQGYCSQKFAIMGPRASE
jgi:hypothetical protein